MNPLLTRNYTAGAAVGANLIVKFDSTDKTVVIGAAATDSLIGVSTNVAAASGDPIDVIHAGIALVKMAGVVTRGGPVTADAAGKGVAADPAATATNRIIGFALETSASGDLVPVLLAPGFLSDAANS
jgi:hypothetical protein